MEYHTTDIEYTFPRDFDVDFENIIIFIDFTTFNFRAILNDVIYE